MSSMVQPIYRTDIFGRENQFSRASSGLIQRADVFARWERRPTAITSPEPRRFTVRLLVDGEPLEFAYTTFDEELPAWTGPVFKALSERWGARPGWDSYDAQPTNPHLVANLLNILLDLMHHDDAPPQVTPLADGGVQAEWHSREQDLEIVVTASEPPSYFYFDLAASTQEEADLDANYARVQVLIGHFNQGARNAK